jgi:hypothetical protein
MGIKRGCPFETASFLLFVLNLIMNISESALAIIILMLVFAVILAILLIKVIIYYNKK